LPGFFVLSFSIRVKEISGMDHARIWSALVIGMVIGGVGGALATYRVTKDKWYALGVDSGMTAGRAEVMHAFCDMGEGNAPIFKADYVLDVKAQRLQAVRQDQGLQIYCE
jgi:hypothetical protein